MKEKWEAILGIIFDMDGTLLDSMRAWQGTGAKLLEAHQIAVPLNLDEKLKAMSLEDMAVYFNESLGLKLTIEEVIEGINAQVRYAYETTVTLKPGIKDMLEDLKHRGIKMCVATATAKCIAIDVLKRLGVLDYFEAVLSCEEVGVGKTQPTIYLKAAEVMGLSLDHVVVVEDALHCIQTAKTAGIKVVGVYDESAKGDNAQIRKVSDIYIDSAAQIGEIL